MPSHVARAEALRYQAISVLQAGDKARAYELLRRAAELNPHDEHVWLWLAVAATSHEEKRRCFKKTLEVNPKSVSAKVGLAELPPPNANDLAAPLSQQSRSTRPAPQQMRSRGQLQRRRMLLYLLLLLVGAGGLGLWVSLNQASSSSVAPSQADGDPRGASSAPLRQLPAGLDLQALLVQPGDLLDQQPIQHRAAAVPAFLPALPVPEQALAITFGNAPATGGYVAVVLYTSAAQRERAFAVMEQEAGSIAGRAGVAAQPLPDIGEHGLIVRTGDWRDLTFTRCHAVVYLRTIGLKSDAELLAYSMALDRRLSAALC